MQKKCRTAEYERKRLQRGKVFYPPVCKHQFVMNPVVKDMLKTPVIDFDLPRLYRHRFRLFWRSIQRQEVVGKDRKQT